MQQQYPLKPRYYPAVKELLKEDEQDISNEAMQRRCLAISILQEYMVLPANPSLIQGADGALTDIVLTIPSYAFQGEHNPIKKVYQHMLLQLPDTVTLYLVTHESIAADINNWLLENNLKDRTKLHLVPDWHKITIWAEDSFELVKDSNDNALCLVQPHSHRRTPDGNIGHLISKAFNWRLSKVPLYFEGGNMLVGDNFILLGADHAVETFRDWNNYLPNGNGTISAALTNAFQKYLDKHRSLYFVGCSTQLLSEQKRTIQLNGEEWTELIYMKNGEGTIQPIFHIDMFITLGGRNSEGKYQLVIGDPRMAATLLTQEVNWLATPDAFDEVAEILARIGFEVIRNPLPLVYVDDPELKLRKWYYASYNNALVEIKSKDERTIWLPTYGHGNWQELTVTDKENKRIWEELGFRVIMLDDFHPFAENAGAVHCIKKYIR